VGDITSTARSRLQTAAVELFLGKGFDQTTAAEIAAKAGVTERTFFRHFADKREVLFDGQAVLSEALLAAIAHAPPNLSSIAVLFRSFRSVCPLLESNRPFSRPRRDVINATPALQERELAKIASLSDSLALALEARGEKSTRASLAAHIGMIAFAYATNAWLEDDKRDLQDRLAEAEREMTSLFRM